MRRRAQGFILLVVLALLVVLTLVAALVYARASDQVIVSSALKRQSVAQDRAITGMRRGIIEIGPPPTNPAIVAAWGAVSGAPCTAPDPISCLPFYTRSSANDPGLDEGRNASATGGLENGEGLQYKIDYIWWQPPTSAAPVQEYVIHATGYDGYAGSNQFTSDVFVEVSAGQPNSGGCVGYCGGGL
jgi:Tfp pilus assembly protein PilX